VIHQTLLYRISGRPITDHKQSCFSELAFKAIDVSLLRIETRSQAVARIADRTASQHTF